MRTLCIGTLLLLSFFTLKASDTSKILFVGNSITYFNDMPFTFENIANDLGQSVEVTMHAPGGTGFAHHINNPALYELIRQGHWDYIVLQPGTGDSGGEQAGGTPIATTVTRIKTLLDSIYLYNPCSEVLFYEISNGVTGTESSNLQSYNASMDLIRSNVQYFSDSTSVAYAPVGEAFKTFWNNNTDQLLWGSFNNIHPNAKGSYLAACVFYASIFRTPCMGTNIVNGLSTSEAESLQLLADTTVLNQLEDWSIGTYDQITDFEYSITDQTVSFINQSENYDSLFWNFGNGQHAYALNPTISYSAVGNYTVSLTSYHHACPDTLSNNISIVSLNVKDKPNEKPSFIYPNPAHNRITVNHKGNANKYLIYNNKGVLILESETNTIDVSELTSGLYIIHIIYSNQQERLLFVKS